MKKADRRSKGKIRSERRGRDQGAPLFHRDQLAEVAREKISVHP